MGRYLLRSATSTSSTSPAQDSDDDTTSTITSKKINPYRFYMEWHGHPISSLRKFHNTVQTLRPTQPIIWLAGDSSLDNKYWVPSSGPGGEPLTVPVPEIYNSVLEHPRINPDVAFWMNHHLSSRATCINTSVEATMLRERDDHLNKHDTFIQNNISSNDALVVSIGANDIALRPTFSTIINMLNLAWLTRRTAIETGSASPLAYFAELFGARIQEYISRITSKTKPRVVIVCMIYFPLEAGKGQQGWADVNLKALGYNRYPSQLQTAIQKIYEIGTQTIRVPGVKVVPCPLYEVLDGQDPADYTARVEPSSEGGRKMAAKFVEMLEREGVVDSRANFF
ncbi:hypothetical protein BU24DRAFT_428205 [Aaosphaeria arxii CBS 175.79]|uniref:SGNH hydrolase n=1 Tax=Aaosphaeria arxii CBS 175.79 TaxID=1450172 RepID=A0A6A5XBA3_9PLEO|nr:uncharacterized protein BU24DRAFT_428205 [Aaosphaeria arxii CBS 175.79]KAF2010183.1 hypothetical protein BU24DRAFT_428205 [Aaosphaeria arxii CBS 175.79]